MCPELQTIDKRFSLVCATQMAAEVEDGVVVLQRESAEELFQFLEPLTDLGRIAFVGFCVGLV